MPVNPVLTIQLDLYLAGPFMRSDRILDGMHHVIRHDLPNQVVALQSLLQLLNTDEVDRLSADGREYVQRLLNATQRASEMVRFLKQMIQLNAVAPRLEAISLASIARELQGELQRLHPAQRFEFEWQWNVPEVIGDTRTFLQALQQCITGFVNPRGVLCRVRASSARRPNVTELAFHMDQMGESQSDGPPTSSRPLTQHALEQTLEIQLGRELLALSNGELKITPPLRGRFTFHILVNHP